MHESSESCASMVSQVRCTASWKAVVGAFVVSLSLPTVLAVGLDDEPADDEEGAKEDDNNGGGGSDRADDGEDEEEEDDDAVAT